MKRQKISFGLAFLDVLSCALGASVLLSVIFLSIKDPPSAPKIKEFIFLVAQVSGNVDVGFEIFSPGGQTFHIFPESATMDPGGEALSIRCWRTTRSDGVDGRLFAKIERPSKGPWAVRPYGLRLYRKDGELQGFWLAKFQWWTLSNDGSALPKNDGPDSQGVLEAPFHFFKTRDDGSLLEEIQID